MIPYAVKLANHQHFQIKNWLLYRACFSLQDVLENSISTKLELRPYRVDTSKKKVIMSNERRLNHLRYAGNITLILQIYTINELIAINFSYINVNSILWIPENSEHICHYLINCILMSHLVVLTEFKMLPNIFSSIIKKEKK